MADTRAEQVTFGWDSQAHAAEPEPRAPSSAPARGSEAERVAATRANEPELPPDNELWDVHAAARFLKRSVSWIYHRAEDGTLPVKRLGGWGVRFIPSELRAWVASGAAQLRRR